MFGDGISFEQRAKFLFSNVCELPKEDLSSICGNDIAQGLTAIRQLLLDIYTDIDTYKTNDPLEGYHNITYTANLFLYSVALVGEVVINGSEAYMTVNKSEFKQEFKKETAFSIMALEKYSVYFEFYKNDKMVTEYKVCNRFNVHFECSNYIPAALKYLAATFKNVDKKNEYGEPITMFGKADYGRLVLKQSGLRENINPLRPDIMKSAGNKSELYGELATALLKLGFSTECYYQHYCCPFWNVNFLKGKKLCCKTMIFYNYIKIDIPVSKNYLEQFVSERNNLPDTIQQQIEKFGCIVSGKCKKDSKSYLRVIDGIKCCFGRAEASTMYLELTSVDEVNAIVNSIIVK